MQRKSLVSWHLPIAVSKTTVGLSPGSYLPMYSFFWLTTRLESLPLLHCALQDTEWYAEAVNITGPSRLSSFSIDPEKKLIPALDTLRRKRNIGTYDDYGLISEGDADHCGKMAVRVRKEVENWIRKNHGDKLR
jgi:hypothetical protein